MDNQKLIPIINQLWECYKKDISGRGVIELDILSTAKKYPSSMWMMTFKSDKTLLRKLSLQQNIISAQEQLNELIDIKNKTGSLSPVMLDMSATLCYTMCRDDYNSDIIDKEKIEQWNEVFKDHFPEFKNLVKEQIKDGEQFRLELLTRYQDQSNKEHLTPNSVYEEVSSVIELLVPMKTEISSGKMVKKCPEKVIESTIDDYNSFGLHQYMDLPYKCNKTTLEAIDDNWHFKFYIREEITDMNNFIEILEKNLAGQLSDGWGENVEQNGLLIDDEVYYAGFDYKNIQAVTTKSKNYKI